MSEGKRMTVEREAEIRDGHWSWAQTGIDDVLRELDATRADLAELVAALPRCVHVQDLDTNPRSCPHKATKGPQDMDTDTIGEFWCDEHAPTDRDIEDCDWPEDLPWADVLRRLAKGTL